MVVAVVSAWAGGGARAEEGARCEPRPACDVASGTGCLDAYEPVDTIFALEVESMDRIGARVRQCAGRWLGERGCYTTEIAKDLSDLGLVAAEISAVADRAQALPEAAKKACEPSRPALATRAMAEVDGWCRIGQGECVGAIDMARIVLKGMDPWHACVERMESRVTERAQRPATVCVEAKPLRVVEAEPLATYAPRPTHVPLEATALASPARTGVTPAPSQTTIAQIEKARVIDARRKGQVELSLAPFSGVLAIEDPATKATYEPLAASVALGVSVVATLASGIDLEVALTGRGTFASTALMDAATAGLDELDTESGSALVLQIEPAVTVLSRYVGVGIVTDFRWDSVGVSSITTGMVRNDSAGVAAGARFIVGLGLLATDLRLLAALDYLFIGTDDSTLRASIRAELGPALITGSYTRYALLGEATDGHVVDSMQLTLGFRMAF